MRRLNQTPLDVMLDEHSRPYFLWDSDLTLDSFRDRLRSPDPKIRGYYLAKLLRQAKPDDAFLFVSLRTSSVTGITPAGSWARLRSSGHG